jgi:hypothetical protein
VGSIARNQLNLAKNLSLIRPRGARGQTPYALTLQRRLLIIAFARWFAQVAGETDGGGFEFCE